MAVQLKLHAAGNVALTTHELNHVVTLKRFALGNHLSEFVECYVHVNSYIHGRNRRSRRRG